MTMSISVGSVCYGVGSLKGLCSGGHISVWEADNGADLHFVADIALCAGNVAGRNADRRAAVFYCLIAELSYLCLGAVNAQQGMIAVGQQFFYIHSFYSFQKYWHYYISFRRHIQAFVPNIL